MKIRKMRDRRSVRRAEQVVESARTEASVILAEARADAALERSLSTQQTQAEIERLCERAAERLRAASTAVAEQFRRDAIAARDEARRELDAERTRWRDEALLDAAKIREHAREEVATLLARITDEHRALIDTVHHDAHRLVGGGASDAQTNQTLEELRQAQDSAAPLAMAAPDAALIDHAVERLLESQGAATGAPGPGRAPVPAPRSDIGAAPEDWTVEALAETRKPDESEFIDGPFKDFWDSSVATWSHGNEVSRPRMRRRRRAASRS